MRRRHWIKDQQLELLLGAVMLGAGFLLLHDAYDGRGLKKPAILGPVLPW